MIANLASGSLLLGLLGLFARPALLVALASLVFLEGASFSFGKVGHGAIPILWGLLFFGLAPCDRAFSLRRVWESRRGIAPPAPTSAFAGWPFDLLLIELATFYFAAGLSKLRQTGVAWMDGATVAASARLRVEDLGLPIEVIDTPWLWAALGTLTLLFELGAIVGVARSARPWVLAAGVGFHVCTGLLLGIWFFPFLGVYLVFVPWVRIFEFVRGRFAGAQTRRPA